MGFWQELKKRTMQFQIYYVAQIIMNVIYLSYYIAMAFKKREDCIIPLVGKDGAKNQNVTAAFSFNFIIGFILALTNFTICTFIEPCIRLSILKKKPSGEGDAAPEGASNYSTGYLAAYWSDIAFRLSFIVFSVM